MSEEPPEAAASDRSTRTIIVLAVRVGCLALLCYWTLVLVAPFLTIIVWSVILAVALHPVFDWLAARIRYGSLAAALITIVGLVVVLGPVSYLGYSMVHSLRTLIDNFNNGDWSIPLPSEAVKSWPLIGEQIYDYWYEAATNLKAVLVKLAPELKPYAVPMLAIAGHVGLDLLRFIAATVLAGFLFVPGPALVERAKGIVRLLATARGEEFLALAGATIRNVSRGVIGVSILQSLLAGLGLLAADIRGAGLLSFLVLFLGVIQVGPSIILVPLIIGSWFTMKTTAALLFTVYMVPVNLLDNVLRPLVMAKGLITPMPVILVGVLGGTLAYGILGLFIGPIVLSIAWQLVTVWWADGAAAIGPADSPPLLE